MTNTCEFCQKCMPCNNSDCLHVREEGMQDGHCMGGQLLADGRLEQVLATLQSLADFPDYNVQREIERVIWEDTPRALRHIEKTDLAGIIASLRALLESPDHQMQRSAFDALQKLSVHIEVEENEEMIVRLCTRGDHKRFEDLCRQEEEKNKNLSRVLRAFLKKRKRIFIQIRGAAYHTERLLQIVYQDRTYEARMYEHMEDKGATLVFGQGILAIVNMETLAEACRRVGNILNEAIRSAVEVDLLYALPNPELHCYDWDDFTSYRVYEAQVRVDFRNPTQLSFNDLKDITFSSS